MWWFKKKRTINEIERELAREKAKYGIFIRTFSIQRTFTDKQREELMNYAADIAELEKELLDLKFKEITNGYK